MCVHVWAWGAQQSRRCRGHGAVAGTVNAGEKLRTAEGAWCCTPSKKEELSLLQIVEVPAGLPFTSCTRSKAWCPAGATNPGEKYRTADGALCCKTAAPTTKPTPTPTSTPTPIPTATPTRDPRIPAGYDSCSRSKAWCPNGACASRTPHLRH